MIRRRYVFWLALLMGSPAFAAPQTADLGISKTDAIGAPSPYSGPGGRIVYTIVVENRGPDPAVNVVFSDPLPAGTTFVSLYVSAAGWETSTPAAGQAGTVTSRIGALSSGADVVFILIVRVDTSVPADR